MAPGTDTLITGPCWLRVPQQQTRPAPFAHPVAAFPSGCPGRVGDRSVPPSWLFALSGSPPRGAASALTGSSAADGALFGLSAMPAPSLDPGDGTSSVGTLVAATSSQV